MAVKKEKIQDESPKFSKGDILKAKKFAEKKDLVVAILPDSFVGTIAEAESEIEKYLKGKVK